VRINRGFYGSLQRQKDNFSLKAQCIRGGPRGVFPYLQLSGPRESFLLCMLFMYLPISDDVSVGFEIKKIYR
jgi:hypothetical protein